MKNVLCRRPRILNVHFFPSKPVIVAAICGDCIDVRLTRPLGQNLRGGSRRRRRGRRRHCCAWGNVVVTALCCEVGYASDDDRKYGKTGGGSSCVHVFLLVGPLDNV